jgi:hypothetical protein
VRTAFGSERQREREAGDTQIVQKLLLSLNIIRVITWIMRWALMRESGSSHNPDT